MPTFSDIPEDHPYYDAIEWAAANGITVGYPDGTYKSDRAVSRGEMAVFLQRFDGADSDPTSSRLSLFVTDAELAKWQDRSVNGPYKTFGDVRANSPADWNRIVTEKVSFVADPSATRWVGPKEWPCVLSTGCIPNIGAGCPTTGMLDDVATLSSAALFALVQQDLTVAQNVASELVAQIDFEDTRFNDRARYCLPPGPTGQSIGLAFMGDWLASHIMAFDFVVAYETAYDVELLTSTEKADYKTWVLGWSEWATAAVDVYLDPLFDDRAGDDYTITALGLGTTGFSVKVYDGGPVPLRVSIRYNNRDCRAMRGAGLAAILAGDTALIAQNKKFWQEVVMFGVAGDPWIADFYRAMTPNHAQGWAYSARMIAPFITIAEALRRTDDFDLYTYSTTVGSSQTSGSDTYLGTPKSLFTAIHMLLRYVSRDESQTYDSVTIRPDDVWVLEVGLMHADHYYDDTFIRDTITRQNTGPYPQSPVTGNFNPWRGDVGVIPAALFMHGPD